MNEVKDKAIENVMKPFSGEPVEQILWSLIWFVILSVATMVLQFLMPLYGLASIVLTITIIIGVLRLLSDKIDNAYPLSGGGL